MRARSRALREAIDEQLPTTWRQARSNGPTVCGRANCRCAIDPTARHGPYFEWTRRSEGHLVHYVVSPEQAQLIKIAIDNHREAQRLLAVWERETAAEITFEEKTSSVRRISRISKTKIARNATAEERKVGQVPLPHLFPPGPSRSTHASTWR